ncbi:hypothetical protein C8D76_11060 [Pasteurella langaaensis DSM 22999]|uniref:Uncharacterized protein n=1 Tax=Alitibacter langaaensis DSM 22999 TaxID=1122935 RepID=A0A2U0SNV1_9PAST|nr:hypothetical protein [Pasteurella langaaensis]PVX33033.1 hypothetical protein C8D76_11060 [Pasteurella langaaensis DSM 22999]
MNGLFDAISKLLSAFALMFVPLVLFVVFSYVGWVNVAKVAAISVIILVTVSIIIHYTNEKPKTTLEDERIAQLNQELSRPIIQATLAKQANEPIDLGEIIKGKATFTDKNGNKKELDIIVNLKLK